MAKLIHDKYYTEESLAEYCVRKTFEVINIPFERVVEPSVGAGAFLPYLPEDTIYYDLFPDPKCEDAIQEDFRNVKLDYIQNSLVIGNPPFGRANKLSVQFVKKAMELGDYCSFIQPISQLNQNRTMKDTELLYSEDLGIMSYAGKEVHCCLNIYHKCLNGHKQNFDIPGVEECRHIFRTGKYKHEDDILNYPWDFRVSAWGDIHLLAEDETCPNEVVFRVKDEVREWIKDKLTVCKYKDIINCVSSPNLPAWRLRKWLKEEWEKEHD